MANYCTSHGDHLGAKSCPKCPGAVDNSEALSIANERVAALESALRNVLPLVDKKHVAVKAEAERALASR